MRATSLQPHDRAVRRGAQDDVAEFLLRHEPALRAHRVGEFLAGRAGPAADLAGRVDGVLAVDGADDLRDGDVELGQLVGLHPDAHGILPGAEDRAPGDARHPAQRVAEVDVGVVGQKLGVAACLWAN